jgi:hypothetical protein
VLEVTDVESEILTWFILAEKPDWANPLDLMVTTYLLVKAREDWKSEVKIADFIRACGVAQYVSVRKSLRRLEEHGWITTAFREGIGLPNIYTVLVDNLPRFDRQALAKETDVHKETL